MCEFCQEACMRVGANYKFLLPIGCRKSSCARYALSASSGGPSVAAVRATAPPKMRPPEGSKQASQSSSSQSSSASSPSSPSTPQGKNSRHAHASLFIRTFGDTADNASVAPATRKKGTMQGPPSIRHEKSGAGRVALPSIGRLISAIAHKHEPLPGKIPQTECPLCAWTCPRYEGTNPNQALYKHISAAHLARGQFPPVKFWEEHNRVFCPDCNQIMPPIKVEGHSAKCRARSAVVPDALPRLPTGGEPEGPPPRLVDCETPLPSLEEVTRTRGATLKFIPASQRDRWARKFSSLCSAAMYHNDVSHWTVALMFARCTLYTAHRGGKNARTNTERVAVALGMFETKKYAEAWAVARGPVRKSAPTQNANTLERKVKQCVARTRDGEYSRALAGLQSADMASPTTETLEILRAKHPKTGRVIVEEEKAPPHTEISSDVVLESLRSFPRGTAAGSLGLRPEHARTAVETSTAMGVLGTLTKLVNFLQAGRATPEIAPFLAGAKLSAFVKKGSKPGKPDVRPVAAGEFLRRLVAKCLCATHKDWAQGHFMGLQFGVATPAGGERIIHRMRAQLLLHEDDPDWVTFKVDLRNAFNEVSRARILELVSAHCPALYAWVAWSYRENSQLVFHDDVIPSAEGVQQGDPLGPLLFSLVLHEQVLRIQTECPELDLHAWYLDEGVLAGRTAVVLKGLKLLADNGPTSGLHLNLEKCELISCHGNQASLDIFPAEIPASKRKSDGCMTLLGAAMGTDEFSQQHFVEQVHSKAAKALGCLGEIDDSQISHTLMRQCTGFGLTVFAIRTTPPHALGDTTKDLDAVCETATETHITGSLSHNAWMQVRHRGAASGMGVRSSHNHREAAYVASVLFAARKDGWDPNTAPGIREAIVAYNAKVAEPSRLPEDAVGIRELDPPTQHDLSVAIDDFAWSIHLSASNEADRLRLTAESGDYAGAWLNAVPSTDKQTAYTSQEWTTLCRWWLGEPVFSEAFPCPACGAENDVFGYHATTCASWGDRVAKHTCLCKEAARVGHTGFLHPEAERNVGPAGTTNRDADVLLRVWEGGKPLAMDFGVTHTQQPSNCTHAGLRPAGSWATEYARLHKSEGRARCAAANPSVPFAAMIVEVFGVWSPEAYGVLAKMAAFVARHTGVETHVARKRVFSRMSCILQRCNVRSILARSNPHRASDDEPLFGEEWPCPIREVEGQLLHDREAPNDHNNSEEADEDDWAVCRTAPLARLKARGRREAPGLQGTTGPVAPGTTGTRGTTAAPDTTAAADKAAADKAAADKAAADKAAADKAAADKAAADNAATNKAAANKATANKAADKAAADKAAADKGTADKAAAKAAADKAVADKAAAGKAAADNADADNTAADKDTADMAVADKAAAHKAVIRFSFKFHLKTFKFFYFLFLFFSFISETYAADPSCDGRQGRTSTTPGEIRAGSTKYFLFCPVVGGKWTPKNPALAFKSSQKGQPREEWGRMRKIRKFWRWERNI